MLHVAPDSISLYSHVTPLTPVYSFQSPHALPTLVTAASSTIRATRNFRFILPLQLLVAAQPKPFHPQKYVKFFDTTVLHVYSYILVSSTGSRAQHCACPLPSPAMAAKKTEWLLFTDAVLRYGLRVKLLGSVFQTDLPYKQGYRGFDPPAIQRPSFGRDCMARRFYAGGDGCRLCGGLFGRAGNTPMDRTH